MRSRIWPARLAMTAVGALFALPIVTQAADVTDRSATPHATQPPMTDSQGNDISAGRNPSEPMTNDGSVGAQDATAAGDRARDRSDSMSNDSMSNDSMSNDGSSASDATVGGDNASPTGRDETQGAGGTRGAGGNTAGAGGNAGNGAGAGGATGNTGGSSTGAAGGGGAAAGGAGAGTGGAGGAGAGGAGAGR